MNKIAFLFIALALPFWCSAQVISSEGITRHVPADYSTIQAAVDAANDGDTILGAIESSFVVGGIEPSTYNSFSLYPNPAEDHVVLLADHYDHYTLELFTSSGQLIQQCDFIGSSYPLDLSSFEKGMYILLIRANGEHWTNRFIKQ